MGHHHTEEIASKDFAKDWVGSSRFVFYLSIISLMVFLFGACYRLSTETYKGKPDVEVQSSSLFTPEYK